MKHNGREAKRERKRDLNRFGQMFTVGDRKHHKKISILFSVVSVKAEKDSSKIEKWVREREREREKSIRLIDLKQQKEPFVRLGEREILWDTEYFVLWARDKQNKKICVRESESAREGSFGGVVCG